MTAIDMIAHHEFVHVISLSRCAASGKTLWSGGRCLPYHTACFVKRHTALGEELGTAIVKRGRAFESFTPEGELIFISAQRMLHEQELLQQTLKGHSEQPVG